jgi:hypothetical protein
MNLLMNTANPMWSSQRLIELSNRIGIQTAAMSNELDRMHWSIKRVNLTDELCKAGFNLPAPF